MRGTLWIRQVAMATVGMAALCTAWAVRAQPEPELPPPPTAASEPEAPSPGSMGVPPSAADVPGATLGPKIELPPEGVAGTPQPSAANTPLVRLGTATDDETLSRGLQPNRLQQPTTVVGGYGQFSLNAVKPGNAKEFDARATVRRLVLFVAHPITEDIRIYTEFEWENAVSCSGCVGSAEVEQAFVHARLLGDALALRAGLLLVPMGIVNQWHEPPVFHGVERPQVDTVIIPSTWRELGLGFAGNLQQIFRYELYATTTLNPLRLNETGLSAARMLGALAPAKAFAVTGRAEVEPILGAIAGASFFVSDMGGNADYYTATGKKRSLKLPIIGYALDARARHWGFEARLVWSQFFLPNSDDLVASYRQDGSPLFPREATEGTVPTRIQGGYIELAYDALSLLHVSHQLLAFVRLETYDTQAAVPKGYKRNPNLDIDELTLGLTYRPIAQLVFKGDLQLRDRRLGWDEVQWDLGFGYMF
jgi:hypothetical protein